MKIRIALSIALLFAAVNAAPGVISGGLPG